MHFPDGCGFSCYGDVFQKDAELPIGGRDLLTRRELQVLAGVNEGLTREQVAARLGIGLETVKCHVKSIMLKLGVPSSAAAVGKAYELGVFRAVRSLFLALALTVPPAGFCGVVQASGESWDFKDEDASYPWSVEVKGVVSKETHKPPRAYLWLPPHASRIAGVVVGMHNMLEEPVFAHPAFRAALASANLGICWVTPMIPQRPEALATNEIAAIEMLMADFAGLSEHAELATVPLAPFGHSAMATYPYLFAAARPERTLCAVSIKGDWPTPGRPCWESARVAARRGIPLLLVSGEYEDGYHRRELSRALMKAEPGATFSMWVDVGGGHFDWSDELCRNLGLWFAAVARLRGVPLRPVANGILQNGFWYPSADLARMVVDYEAQPRGKGKVTVLGYVVNGRKIVQNPKAHAQVVFGVVGPEFEIEPRFEEVVPPGRPVTWTGIDAGSRNPRPVDPGEVRRILVQRINGPVEHVGGNRWRVKYGCYDPAGRRASCATLQMVYPGGNGFKRCVQQAEVHVPAPKADAVMRRGE